MILELLIWLKQSMPGSVVPLAMFDAMFGAKIVLKPCEFIRLWHF